MSGRIGGRSNVAHKAAPTAAFPPIELAQVVPQCGFFDSAHPTIDGPCGNNSVASGDTGCDLIGFTWQPATVNIHWTITLYSDVAPIAYSSPSLSGLFHTIDLVHTQDFVDNLTPAVAGMTPPYYATSFTFVCYGPPSAGDMRLELGSTNAATGFLGGGLPFFMNAVAVANCAGDASAVRQMEVSAGFATLPSAPAPCNSVTGTVTGLGAVDTPYPDFMSRAGGICGGGFGVQFYVCGLAFIDVPAYTGPSYGVEPLFTPGPTADGGSVMIEWIAL